MRTQISIDLQEPDPDQFLEEKEEGGVDSVMGKEGIWQRETHAVSHLISIENNNNSNTDCLMYNITCQWFIQQVKDSNVHTT